VLGTVVSTDVSAVKFELSASVGLVVGNSVVDDELELAEGSISIAIAVAIAVGDNSLPP